MRRWHLWDSKQRGTARYRSFLDLVAEFGPDGVRAYSNFLFPITAQVWKNIPEPATLWERLPADKRDVFARLAQFVWLSSSQTLRDYLRLLDIIRDGTFVVHLPTKQCPFEPVEPFTNRTQRLAGLIEPRQTTSVKIDPLLWKEVKKLCVDEEVEISEYLEWLIRRDMASYLWRLVRHHCIDTYQEVSAYLEWVIRRDLRAFR